MGRPQCVLPQGCWLARTTFCCFATQLDIFLSLWLSHVEGLSGCWNTSQISMQVERKLSACLADIYYSPRGYWKGLATIKNLSAATKVTEQRAKDWLKKQAIWHIYLPAPRHIPQPKFDVAVPNEVHQANLLFLPHDRVKRKTFRYVLTVVDVASRYKEAEPLTSKTDCGRGRIWPGSNLQSEPLRGRGSFRLTLGASSWMQ